MEMKKKHWFQRDRLNKALSGETGQSLVETALAVAFLVPLLLGVVEFGSLAYVAIEVSNAARAAVQYGASGLTAAADGPGIILAAQNEAPNLSTLTVPVHSTACTCANPAFTPTSCSDNSTCLNGNTTMEQTLTVQTQATVVALIHLPGGPTSFTLQGHAVQKVSNKQ
jgi:Flp pilus assembly protein TadG